MNPFRPLAFCLLIVSLCFVSPLFAQSDNGNIRGTVTDPNGAVVPNARVVLTSQETNQTRETTTSDDGTYAFPEIKAGLYKVSVDAAGFQGAITDDVKVAVQSTHSVNIQLQIGVATNVVTVQAEGQTLNADTPVRQTNITERQVRELPLVVSSESAGRTPLAFIFLDSNVASTQVGGATDASRFRVSGGQGSGTEILIDGASARRTQNGTFFTEIAPGPNAYREFTISTSSYSAEFGNSSGGIVNFSLKSGTNEFHGEAYDLLRNEKFNANTISNIVNGRPRDRDNQNNYGANIGGPIPFLGFGEGVPFARLYKDRAFFFLNYEGYRTRRGTNAVLTVPTLRMRTGDFGELLTDPYVVQFFGGPVRVYDPRCPSSSRQVIPNNRLDLVSGAAPAGCVQRPLLDPAGLAIAQRFPEPTRAGVFRNYDASVIAPQDSNQWTIKTDFVISDKQRLTISFARRDNVRLAGPLPVFPLPFTSFDTWQQVFRSNFFRIQHDYNLSPTLLNHFNFGWSLFDVSNQNTTFGFNTSSLGIPSSATQNSAFPRIDFPNYGGINSADPRRVQNIGSSFFSDRIRDKPLEISDFVTWVTGRHSFKFGGSWRWGAFNVIQLIDPGGAFNFRNDQTAADSDPTGGWPVASLVTGATEFAFNSNNSINPRFRQFTQGYFAQDDFKLTRKLTLNIGVRYDLPGLRYEEQNRFRGFDPTVANPQAGGRLGAIIGAGGQSGLQAERRTLARQDKTNIGPRLGAAYALNNRTVIRAGIGLYYAPILYGTEGGGDINSGTIGYNTTGQLFTPDGRNSRNFLSTFPSIPPVDPNSQFVGQTGVAILQFGNDFHTGRTLQYSIDIQRELPWNFVVSVGYIGHRADRLRSNFNRINALPLNVLRLGNEILRTNINDVTAQQRAFASSIGVTIPGSASAVYPGFNDNVAQALRPFPQYGRVTDILESEGKSRYNALQVKLERRFAQGIQFGLAYTFSRLVTNASEDVLGGGPLAGVLQNPFDRSSLFTVSSTNSPHVFVTNFLIELPFGKGKHFLNKGAIVNTLLGGFQVSGILRYQQGTPLVITLPDNVGFLELAGVFGNLRPNLTGQPLTVSRSSVAGAPGQFFYLNPAAFSAPPRFNAGPAFIVNGQINPAYAAYYTDPTAFFGSSPPVITGARSPVFFDENISVLKKTRITETLAIELGAEFFNVFNRVRYFAPNTDLGNLANGNRNTNFGVIGDTSTPRVIQLRARIIF